MQRRATRASRTAITATAPSLREHWLPRRTGAVVILALLAIFDVLAILVVLTILGAVAAGPTPTSANARFIHVPVPHAAAAAGRPPCCVSRINSPRRYNAQEAGRVALRHRRRSRA